MKSVTANAIPFEVDLLDEKAKVNEYIMTTIRTKWGCDLKWVENNFRINLMQKYRPYIQELTERKLALLQNNVLTLTNRGKLIADKITEDLFME